MAHYDSYRRAHVARRRGRRTPWEVRWSCPGPRCPHCRTAGRTLRQEYHARYFPTRETAEAFRRRIEDQLNGRLLGRGDRKAWLDAVDAYDDHTVALSDKHRWAIERCLVSFTRLVQPVYVDDVQPADCERYFAELARGKLPGRRASDAEHEKDRRVLHAFFAWAGPGRPGHPGHKWIAENPVAIVPRIKLDDRLPDVPAEREFLGVLRTLSNPPRVVADPLLVRLAALGAVEPEPQPALARFDRQAWYIYVLLAAYTGIDQADLLRITINRRTADEAYSLELDVSDGAGLVWGRRSKTRKPIPHGLPPSVNDLVAQRIADLPAGTTMLFPWRSFQRKQWAELRRVAGFAYEFKALRKLHASSSGEAQALAAAAEALGHSRTQVTRRHYYPDADRTLAAALARPVPALPPLPRYAPPVRGSIRGRAPSGNA